VIFNSTPAQPRGGRRRARRRLLSRDGRTKRFRWRPTNWWLPPTRVAGPITPRNRSRPEALSTAIRSGVTALRFRKTPGGICLSSVNQRNSVSCLILAAYQVANDRTARGEDFANWRSYPLAEHFES